MARSRYELIGTRHMAMAGAAEAARRRGYDVVVVAPPVLGEARAAGAAHVTTVRTAAGSRGGPICVLSSGETTVTVLGKGRGGRNQEFVAGAIDALSREPRPTLLSSIGTDGIDGPTDCAGAWADNAIAALVHSQGLSVDSLLRDNNAYELHRRLGTLVRTGPTDTNVGDLQVALVY
jgi:hydroxypyruvate reductase